LIVYWRAGWVAPAAMSTVAVLPIPGGNWPPGVTIAITALALLQRDGLLMLLSVPAAAISVGVAYVGVRLGWAALSELGQLIHSWLLPLLGGFGAS